jgi:hypothetical protein
MGLRFFPKNGHLVAPGRGRFFDRKTMSSPPNPLNPKPDDQNPHFLPSGSLVLIPVLV